MADKSEESRQKEQTGRTEPRGVSRDEERSKDRDYPERAENYVVPDGDELKDKKARDRRLLKEALVDHETLDHEDLDPALLDADMVDERLEEALNVAELPIEEVSLEELEEDDDALYPYDTTRGDFFDTAHSDGSTQDPDIAWQQGLVYTPPDDPPVVPSDDLQGVEISAGFGNSIEEAGVEAEDFPDRVDNNDADLEFKVREALRYNSETTTLDNLHVRVRNSIVLVAGTVEFDEDIELIDSVVRFIDGVADVRYQLRIAADADDERFDEELDAELDEAELFDADLTDADIAGIDTDEEFEEDGVLDANADDEDLNEFGLADEAPEDENDTRDEGRSGRRKSR
jgi:hypothetical protein